MINELRIPNKDKRVIVDTVAFFARGPYQKVLKQLADENGGMFKCVSETDLAR